MRDLAFHALTLLVILVNALSFSGLAEKTARTRTPVLYRR